MDDKKYDYLLGVAFHKGEETPKSWESNVMGKINEPTRRRRKHKKLAMTVLLILALALPTSAFAYYHFLSPQEVALLMEDSKLAEAFGQKSQDVQTIEDGDYRISMLGAVSGMAISNYINEDEIEKQRTYTVIAIQRADGEAMENMGEFYVTPLIEGLNPLQWNVAVFDKNGYSGSIKDGVQYIICETDNLEIFSYRQVYLAVIEDQIHPSKETITFDRKTGRIGAEEGYEKTNVLFSLELNKDGADQKKAETFIKAKQREMESEKTPGITLPEPITKKIDGITLKINPTSWIHQGEEGTRFDLRLFVSGKDIKSVAVKSTTVTFLLPKEITEAEYQQINKEWEEDGKDGVPDMNKELQGLTATGGHYFLWDYSQAKTNLTLDLKKMTEALYNKDAIAGFVDNQKLQDSEIQIIVTKKDGSQTEWSLNLDATEEVEGGFKYLRWKIK